MKWLGIAAVGLGLAVGVVATACGGNGDDGALEDTPTGTSAAVATSTSVVTETTETPSTSAEPTAMPVPRTGAHRYNVTYSTISTTCEEEILDTFDGTLEIRIQEGTIDIHAEPGSTDSAGTITPDGVFAASGSGQNYSETWEGRLEDGRIEAVNDHDAAGCTVKFSVTGKRETQE